MNILDSYAGIDLEPNGGWNRVESLQTISEKEVEDLRKKSGLPAAAKPRGISLFFYFVQEMKRKSKSVEGCGRADPLLQTRAARAALVGVDAGR